MTAVRDHLWATRLLDERMRYVRTDPKSQFNMQTLLTDMAILADAGHSDVAVRMLTEWWELVSGSR